MHRSAIVRYADADFESTLRGMHLFRIERDAHRDAGCV
jgi:hypothetical protein